MIPGSFLNAFVDTSAMAPTCNNTLLNGTAQDCSASAHMAPYVDYSSVWTITSNFDNPTTYTITNSLDGPDWRLDVWQVSHVMSFFLAHTLYLGLIQMEDGHD